MVRTRNVFVEINRRYPWVKVVILGVIVFMVIMGVGIGSTKGGQMITILANTGVDMGHNESFKIDLGGVETEVSGVREFEEQVNNNVEQRDLEGKQLVALTFDDGPDTEITGRILDTLKEKNVKATFFMLGIMVEKMPDMAKRVAKEGHEVETHSLRHANLSQMNREGVIADLEQSRQIMKDMIGVDVKILRPPYGAVNDTVKEAVNMPMITWGVDPYDWRDKDAGLIKDRVVDASYDGAIVLMHDIYSTTAEAIPWIIDELRGKGFEFVTVEELAKKKGIVLNNGDLYRDFAS